MYNIIKNVINTGVFGLTDIIKKIESQWVAGKITEEEKNKLILFAQERAKPQNDVDILKKIAELEIRIRVVEDKQNASENTDEEGYEVPETPSEEYPPFVVGKWYYNGDKTSHEGKNYVCIAPEGQVCTWNPVEYPAYWQEVE